MLFVQPPCTFIARECLFADSVGQSRINHSDHCSSPDPCLAINFGACLCSCRIIGCVGEGAGIESLSFSVMPAGLLFCSLVEALDVVNVSNIGFDISAPCRDVIGRKVLLFGHLLEV